MESILKCCLGFHAGCLVIQPFIENKANKAKNPSEIKNFQKQRSHVVQLDRKIELAY